MHSQFKLKVIREGSVKVVPLHSCFMTPLCNYQCDVGYFLLKKYQFNWTVTKQDNCTEQ